MMAITEADVRKMADLARLTLAESELPSITAQMNNILAHMDVLGRIDTSSAELRDAADARMPLRDDVVAPIPMNSTAPLLAPESLDGFILVPRLSTHEDV